MKIDIIFLVVVREYVYGEDMSFFFSNYFDEVIKDWESVMIKVFGIMFWWYNLSYFDVMSVGLVGFDEIVFNYYKGVGGVWIILLCEVFGNVVIV